jgi:hypothetical protein
MRIWEGSRNDNRKTKDLFWQNANYLSVRFICLPIKDEILCQAVFLNKQ